MIAKMISAVAMTLLAFAATCSEVWLLDDSAPIPGKFWTLSSPDKKWKLACVPSYRDNVLVDSKCEADLVICSKYEYTNCYEYYCEWEEYETEEIYNKEIDCVLAGSGVLTLPVKARNSRGEEFSVELADWAMEGWYQNGGGKISKCVIPAGYTSYFGEGTSLASFEVESGNPKYYSADGVLYLKSSARDDRGYGDVLMQFSAGKTGTFVIPDGVTTVRRGAFERASVSELVIGSDLEVFESDSEVLNKLKKITVKDNDRFIYANGLLLGDYGNTVVLSLHGVLASMADINVPASVCVVDEYSMAYLDSSKIKNIIFSSPVLEMAEDALHDCVIPSATVDFGAVGTLYLDPYALSETTAKAVILPENTMFGGEWEQYLELGETGIRDIYWYTDKSYEESGLEGVYTWEGRVRLHVLKNAGDWSGFDCYGVSVVKDLDRTSMVQVVPSDVEGGKVAGAGRYAEGKVVTLKATANKGYVFSYWDGPLDEGVDPQSTTVTYVAGVENVEFVANFIPVEDDWVDVWIENNAEEYETNVEIDDVYVCVEGASLSTVKVSGLPAGLKFTNKAIVDKKSGDVLHEANTIYGTPTKSGVYTVTATATSAGKKTCTATLVIVVRKEGEQIVKLLVYDWWDEEKEEEVVPGKVTGAGIYAEGKKVALKATANKGFVFAGWYNSNSGDPLWEYGDYLNPALSYEMGDGDIEIDAMFIPVEYDWVDVWFENEEEEFETNAEIDDIYIGLEGATLSTVKIAGLPAGLKFTDKEIVDKKDGYVIHEANTIYGTPTKSGVYTVTATATSAGKKTDTASIVIIVRKEGEQVVKLHVNNWWDEENEEEVVPGKVTGAGIYAEGKKVTLKATANKGFVFAGWYNSNSGDPLWEYGDYLNPTLSYEMESGDVAIDAMFIPVEDDCVDIWLENEEEYETNVEINDIYVGIESTSYATVKVSGLPPGLKFTDKAIVVQGRNHLCCGAYIIDANTIYGTPTKSGVYTVTATATSAGKKTDTITRTFVVRNEGEKIVKLLVSNVWDEEKEEEVVPGKVTGAGIYVEGKKVNMKATANKGYVFAGWWDVDAEEWFYYGDGDYRNPSLSFEMGYEDKFIVAMFEPDGYDDTLELRVVVDSCCADGVIYDITENVDDNVITLESDSRFYLDIESLSLPKAAVSGLPKGMKFDSKSNTISGNVTAPGMYTVTVKLTNATIKKAEERKFKIEAPNLTEANHYFNDYLRNEMGEKCTIPVGVANASELLPSLELVGNVKLAVSGLPAGLKYDAKTGAITGVATKPGTYTVTLTVADGKEKYISTMTIEVEALPSWVVGTFEGYLNVSSYQLGHWEFCDRVVLTVGANGKVTCKGQVADASWYTYKGMSLVYVGGMYMLYGEEINEDCSDYRSWYIEPYEVDGVVFGRVFGEVWIYEYEEWDDVWFSYEGYAELSQNVWQTAKGTKLTPEFAKDAVTVFDMAGIYDSEGGMMEYGWLNLKFGKNGAVTATYSEVDGGKATATGLTQLVPYDASGDTVYAWLYTALKPRGQDAFGVLLFLEIDTSSGLVSGEDVQVLDVSLEIDD